MLRAGSTRQPGAGHLHAVAPPPVSPDILQACADATQSLGGIKIARLGVTSSIRGEGRTTIATAMAYIQATLLGRSTLLLDLDIEQPGLAAAFHLPRQPGLVELLPGKVPVEDAVHAIDGHLHVMAAGSITDSAARFAFDLLASNLLDQLQSRFEVIVADLPAIVHSACGAALAGAFTQPLLVVRADITTADLVRQATGVLNAEPAVILNGARSHIPRWIRQLVGTR